MNIFKKIYNKIFSKHEPPVKKKIRKSHVLLDRDTVVTIYNLLQEPDADVNHLAFSFNVSVTTIRSIQHGKHTHQQKD